MNRFILQLLTATVLTGFVTSAYANPNINTFVAVDPTKKTVTTINQSGTDNAISGSVLGTGNKFAIAQSGSSNTTQINTPEADLSTAVVNSTFNVNSNGSSNAVAINVYGHTLAGSISDVTASNEKVNVAITGYSNDDSQIFIGGDNNTLTHVIKGNNNIIGDSGFGDNVSNNVQITGNKNTVNGFYNYNYNPANSPNPVYDFSGSKLTASINGSNNYIENNIFSTKEVVNETISGGSNYVSNQLLGDSNKINISQTGDQSGFLIVGDASSNNSSTVIATADLAKVTMVSSGSNNQVRLGFNPSANSAVNYSLFPVGPNEKDTFSSNLNGSNDIVRTNFNITNSDTVTENITGDYNNLATNLTAAANATVNVAISGYGNNQSSGNYGNQVTGNHDTLTQIINGSQNDVKNTALIGDNASSYIKVTGNKNTVDSYFNPASQGSNSSFTGSKLSASINGSNNYVQNGVFSTNEVVSESIQGGTNYVSNQLFGDSNHITLSQTGDQSGLLIVGDASSNNNGSANATADFAKVTMVSNGSNNQMVTGFNPTMTVQPSDWSLFSVGPNELDTLSSTSNGSNNILKANFNITNHDVVTQNATSDNNQLTTNLETVANSTDTVTANGYGNKLSANQEGISGSTLSLNVTNGNLNNFAVYQIQGTNDKASVTVKGSNNTATQGGPTQGNPSQDTHQFSGTNDTLTVGITGDNNQVSAAQNYNDNSSLALAITGGNNYASIAQGSLNGQGAPKANSTNNKVSAQITGSYDGLLASQQGSYDTISATIKGSYDEITANQLGSNNTITASIVDSLPTVSGAGGQQNNLISGTQNGSNNQMVLNINGMNDSITATQTGNNNVMNVAFKGTGDTGTFNQTGNNLNYSLSTNLSGKTFTVNQIK